MTARADEQLLTFLLAGEEYAVSILAVREIVACGTITRVPAMPPFVRGAMNLRGRAIPVIDLALKFNGPETAITRWTCLMIAHVPIRGELTVLGILVEQVSSLIETAAAAIEPPPALGTRIHPAYLRGLLRRDDKLVVVLDIERVLSSEELLQVAPPPGSAADASARPPERPQESPQERKS